MYESTSKLLRRLRHPESGQAFLRQCTDTPSAAQVLRDLLAQAGLSVSDWIAAADISRSYGYQILRGERNPGRDVLLRTALALFLSLEDTITVAFVHLIGFDILFFVPTGYQCVERYFNQNIMEEHKLGE